MSLGAAFVRVSTGSQDETSQVRGIETAARERGITIVKTFRLKGYSASQGEQEPALQEAIADIQRGDYSTLIVTESSRLDRRTNLDAQAEILLAIRYAGGDVLSLSEPSFGKTDFAGRVVTLAAQNANAEKSRQVKRETYRGICMIRDNNAHHGPLPAFWKSKGVRYAKQAYCVDEQAVNDVFARVAKGESMSSVGRSYGLYPNSVRNLIRFEANHTGFVVCSYTFEGETDTWSHEVEPVVASDLWWRANKVLDANKTLARVNKGGRPVASPVNWLSGVLDCPECGGKLYIPTGRTPAGNPRKPKLRCQGRGKKRLACGRFGRCDAVPVIELIDRMFASDTTDILSFQRVAGNAHELDALKAAFSKIHASFAKAIDNDKFNRLVAERAETGKRIEEFVIEPDRFDYAPTGQTVAEKWTGGDETVKREMVCAVKDSWGLNLVFKGDEPRIVIGTAPTDETADGDGVADLGNGLCIRRQAA